MAKDVSTGPPSARDGNEGERDLYCRLLFNNPAKYSILIVDDAGIIVTWSEGARTLYGYSEDEIIGKPLATLFSGKTSGPAHRNVGCKQSGPKAQQSRAFGGYDTTVLLSVQPSR